MIAQLSIGTSRSNDDSRTEQEEPMRRIKVINTNNGDLLFARNFFTIAPVVAQNVA
jgi:hypothetical protein